MTQAESNDGPPTALSNRTVRIARTLIQPLILVLIAGAVSAGGSVHAALLQLPDIPLFLDKSVTPNVFFTLDDSLSMDEDILTREHWDHLAYEPDRFHDGGWRSTDARGRFRSRWYSQESFGPKKTGVIFEYVLHHQDDKALDLGGMDCLTDGRVNGHLFDSAELCQGAPNPVDIDWRIRGGEFNVVYYNPGSSYRPWIGPCADSGVKCADARFDSARSNPYSGTEGYPLTRNLGTHHGGFVYEVWIDDKGYNGDRPRRGVNFNDRDGANDEVDVWDSHVRFTVGKDDITVTRFTYDPQPINQGAIKRGLNETSTTLATLSNTNACYDVLGPKPLVQQIFASTTPATAAVATGAVGCRTIAQTKQNIANWYSYARRRSFVAKGAIAEVLNTTPNFRYGLALINDYDSLFKEVPGASVSDYTSHNLSLLKDLYAYDIGVRLTPLRTALQRTGDYFKGELDVNGTTLKSPIVNDCQRNFNMLITDGFYNGKDPDPSIGDVDGDGVTNRLADVAAVYYKNDLSNRPNKIPATDFDPLTHQHLNTFGIAFGVVGALKDTDSDGWPNPNGAADKRLNERGQVIDNDAYLDDTTQAAGGWGDPTAAALKLSQERMDDLWHAAYNSRGAYAAAANPEEFVKKLLEAIQTVRAITATTATAQSSISLQSETSIYRANF
ncbi:MAG: hypothetical protein ACR2RB_17345, partial [Gammaproteobacteria bacterium]